MTSEAQGGRLRHFSCETLIARWGDLEKTLSRRLGAGFQRGGFFLLARRLGGIRLHPFGERRRQRNLCGVRRRLRGGQPQRKKQAHGKTQIPQSLILPVLPLGQRQSRPQYYESRLRLQGFFCFVGWLNGSAT